MIRVLPLTILAGVFACAPWLRAYPSSVLAGPLLAAAVASVLVPIVTTTLLTRRLLVTVFVDVVAFVGYTLVVVLQSPTGFGSLRDGLVHGPAQILTFALPLVSPRALLVAPVALCWLVGAVAGECLARRWSTVLPYAGWLAGFGLAYAATERANGDAFRARVYDTLLGLGLLTTLLLIAVAQSWLRARGSSDERLPVRTWITGGVVTALVAAVAAGSVQTPVFAGAPVAPQRVPPVSQSTPLTPLAFVAALRPQNPTDTGPALFSVTVDATAPAYIGLATVDLYDGDGWSFARTFRPSGGVIPTERDPALRPRGPAIDQRYKITGPELTAAPWMPSLYRAMQVTGAAVNVDGDSGMIVPAAPLRVGESYSVRSSAATTAFGELPPTALPATSAPPIDTQLPSPLRATLGTVVNSLAGEVGQSPSSGVPFLQALVATLRTHYSLAGRTPKTQQKAGSTGFADVLASVAGAQHAATPEQFATLVALVARQLGVPARVVTGFRATAGASTKATTLAPGTYTITAGQAWTWVEVPVRGVGWVVLDPSPGTYADANRDPSAAEAPPTPSAPPTQIASLAQNNGGHAVAPRSAVHTRSGSNGSLAVGIAAGIGALVALVLIVLLLRKARRVRRRRRAPDPRQRVLGAWHESLDVLAEAGLPDLTTLTSAEISAVTGGHFDHLSAVHAGYLGDAANAAMYRPSAVVTVEEADRVWNIHRALRKHVRRQLKPHQRLRATLAYHRRH